MRLNTLLPFTPTMVEPLPNRQGRSQKKLRPVIQRDGRVFVARFEGRPGFCWGMTEKEATYNLRAGAQWL